MYTYETRNETNMLFIILLGAIVFVFSNLSSNVMVMSWDTHFHRYDLNGQQTTTKYLKASQTAGVNAGSFERSYKHVNVETWRNNILVDVPKGHDVMTADWNDLECLAVNIYHEARGEPKLGQELVAQVVVNRMNKKWWPETACGVIRQAYQFSWTHDGKSDQVVDMGAYKEAYLIAIEYLRLKKQADVPHASQIVNYHNHTVNPNWTNMTPVQAKGKHQFYRPAYYATRM